VSHICRKRKKYKSVYVTTKTCLQQQMNRIVSVACDFGETVSKWWRHEKGAMLASQYFEWRFPFHDGMHLQLVRTDKMSAYCVILLLMLLLAMMMRRCSGIRSCRSHRPRQLTDVRTPRRLTSSRCLATAAAAAAAAAVVTAGCRLQHFLSASRLLWRTVLHTRSHARNSSVIT